MEPDYDKKCIFGCVVRFDDSALVYAGLDDTGAACIALFLYLFYPGTDLSGTTDSPGNYNKVPGSTGLDCIIVCGWKSPLGEGKKEEANSIFSLLSFSSSQSISSELFLKNENKNVSKS